jgi:hypothetical protein
MVINGNPLGREVGAQAATSQAGGAQGASRSRTQPAPSCR